MRLEQQPGALAKLARQTPSGTGPFLTPVGTATDRLGQIKRAVNGLSPDALVEIMKFQSDPAAVRYATAVRVADEALLDIVNNPYTAALSREYEPGTRTLDAHIAALKTVRK